MEKLCFFDNSTCTHMRTALDKPYSPQNSNLHVCSMPLPKPTHKLVLCMSMSIYVM